MNYLKRNEDNEMGNKYKIMKDTVLTISLFLKLVMKILVGIFLCIFFCILITYLFKIGMFLSELKIHDIDNLIILLNIIPPYQNIILVISGLFIVYLFRKELKLLLEKMTYIQLPGIGVGIRDSENQSTPPQRNVPNLGTASNTGTVPNTGTIPNTGTTSNAGTAPNTSTTSNTGAAPNIGITSDDTTLERYNSLLNNYNELYNQYNLEWILNEIMGTQLSLLERLFDMQGSSDKMYLINARIYYQQSCQFRQNLPNTFGEQQYFEFLIRCGLITIDSTSGAIQLMQLGINLVSYKRLRHPGIQRFY